MGIDVRVESEDGVAEATLHDSDDLTEQLLPALEDERSPCLRFIDPYGDTTFNQLQLPFLIKELEAVVATVGDAILQKHGTAILKLAKRSASEVHTYLKFYGD